MQLHCLNRTFMELKHEVRADWNAELVVLIEPLWNWNWFKGEADKLSETVLIEPLWNWNNDSRFNRDTSSRLNRTFMELKR